MKAALQILLAATAALSLSDCGKKPTPLLTETSPTAVVSKPAEAAPPPQPGADLPAGTYTLDKNHSTLIFKLSHLGFSNYTASFGAFDAKLQLDPAKAMSSTLSVTIDPHSLQIPTPPAGFLDTLKGEKWLDVAHFPTITYVTTRIEQTAPDRAHINGDLTLHGVTKPVGLDVKFNGGYPSMPMEQRARIGFSAKGTFKRADFGMAYGVPPPGSSMGVSDDVDVIIEAEFNGPPAAEAAPASGDH